MMNTELPGLITDRVDPSFYLNSLVSLNSEAPEFEAFMLDPVRLRNALKSVVVDAELEPIAGVRMVNRGNTPQVVLMGHLDAATIEATKHGVRLWLVCSRSISSTAETARCLATGGSSFAFFSGGEALTAANAFANEYLRVAALPYDSDGYLVQQP